MSRITGVSIRSVNAGYTVSWTVELERRKHHVSFVLRASFNRILLQHFHGNVCCAILGSSLCLPSFLLCPNTKWSISRKPSLYRGWAFFSLLFFLWTRKEEHSVYANPYAAPQWITDWSESVVGFVASLLAVNLKRMSLKRRFSAFFCWKRPSVYESRVGLAYWTVFSSSPLVDGLFRPRKVWL